MSDNKNKTGKADRIRINFHEAYELDYWKNKWKITGQQLEDAHQQTGSVMVKKIEIYLRRQGFSI